MEEALLIKEDTGEFVENITVPLLPKNEGPPPSNLPDENSLSRNCILSPTRPN